MCRIILGLIVLLSSVNAVASGLWEQDNCFLTSGNSSLGQKAGFLCIDDLSKLDGRYVENGTSLMATFFISADGANPIARIPLTVTVRDLVLGRFADIRSYKVEGIGDGFSLTMVFLPQGVNRQMPNYSQESGVLRGNQGDQIIIRYVWEESSGSGGKNPNDPFPPGCKPGHCH